MEEKNNTPAELREIAALVNHDNVEAKQLAATLNKETTHANDTANPDAPVVSSMGYSQQTTEEGQMKLNANYKFVARIFTNAAYPWEEEFVCMEDFKAEKFNYVVHNVEPEELTEHCKFAIFLFIIDDKNTRRRLEKKLRKKKYNLVWNVYEYEPVME